MNKVNGFKTYSVCLAMVIVAIHEFVTSGVINSELLMQAGALAGLRHAVK